MSIGEPEFVTTNGQPRSDHDRVIVSCAIGADYQEELHSARLHCEANVPEAWRLFYRELPLGCPSHQQSNYAFKIWALRRAIAAGFRFVVWMDASFQPVASMLPIWERLRNEGWYVAPQGGARLGSWVTDDFLAKTRTKREDLMQVPLVYSGLVALDMRSHAGKSIWKEWEDLYAIGTFNGPHLNVRGGQLQPWGGKFQGHCSDDPRCEGHRHDEAALSLALHRLGLVPVTTGFLTLESPGGFIDRHVKLQIPKR